MEAVATVRDLRMRYGDNDVLAGVDFDIARGQIHYGLLSTRWCGGLQTSPLALSFRAHGYLQKGCFLESIPNQNLVVVLSMR